MQSFFCLGGWVFWGGHLRSETQRDRLQGWGQIRRRCGKSRNMQEIEKHFVFVGVDRPTTTRLPPHPTPHCARMTCNYAWDCPMSEVTQITPSFNSAVKMRLRKKEGGQERKTPRPDPHSHSIYVSHPPATPHHI